jgi:hypothetical protein
LERNPRPFTWHKSAEEILDQLAGYCRSLKQLAALQPDRTLGQGGRIHLVVLEAGRGDRLAAAGMDQVRLQLQLLEQIYQPARP